MTGSNTQHNPLTTCGMADEATGRLGLQDWLFIVGLTLIALVMNVSRPLTVDDPPYLAHAAQMAENPLKPYDFSYTYTEWPEQGLFLPSPPVVAVSSAVCIKIFGDDELALKVWMTGYAFLLFWSMFRLAKPWAGPWTALGVGTMLAGPIILPGLKVMLDIPAAALVTTGVCLARDYLERQAGLWALLCAGLACALAPLAKYSGFSVAPAVFLLACLYGRPLLGLALAAAPVVLFLAWEGFVYKAHGVSHILYQMNALPAVKDPLLMIESFLVITSNGMPLLLAAVGYALGLKRAWWISLAAIGLGTQVVLMFTHVSLWVFIAQSTVVWAGLAWLAVRLLRSGFCGSADARAASPAATGSGQGEGAGSASVPGSGNGSVVGKCMSANAVNLFVVGWLAIEVLTTLAITPFPAYRRFVAVMLAAGLLIARAGHLFKPTPDRLAVVLLMAGSLVSSLIYFHADRAYAKALLDGMVQAKALVDEMRQPGDRHAFYILGRWTVPYYAPRLGIPELVLDQTRLNPGDLVLISSAGAYLPDISLEPNAFEVVRRFNPIENYPLNPNPTYSGTSGLEHGKKPGVEFTLVRTLKPTVIRALLSKAYIDRLYIARKNPANPLVSWSLLEFALMQPDPFANPYADKLLAWGDPFLIRALEHPAAAARLWTLALIAKNPKTMTPTVREAVERLRQDGNPGVRNAAKQLAGDNQDDDQAGKQTEKQATPDRTDP